MKAIVYPKYGPPEVLEIKEVEKPIPGEGELLIKIRAATVNRTDCANMRAKPFAMRFIMGLFKPKKPILGTEFAGEIEAVGESVSAFQVGDRVFGFNDVGLGSHAQYLTISEQEAIATIPSDITFEQAAASTEGAHYGINMINKVALEAGQKVLVNGATGGIGSATVQLLKFHKAHVTAVGNTEKLDLVNTLGADEAMDYTKEDFTQKDQLYNYIFDTVGKSTFGKCKPLLLSGGVYISSELGRGGSESLFHAFHPPIREEKSQVPLPFRSHRECASG